MSGDRLRLFRTWIFSHFLQQQHSTADAAMMWHDDAAVAELWCLTENHKEYCGNDPYRSDECLYAAVTHVVLATGTISPSQPVYSDQMLLFELRWSPLHCRIATRVTRLQHVCGNRFEKRTSPGTVPVLPVQGLTTTVRPKQTAECTSETFSKS